MLSEAARAEIDLLRKIATMAEFDGRPDLAQEWREKADALESEVSS